MSIADDMPVEDRREELEREAEVVRTRLSNGLAMLGARRERLVENVKNFARPPKSIAIIVGAGLAVTATVLIVRGLRRRKSPFERFLEEVIAEARHEAELSAPRVDGPVMRAVKRGVSSAIVLGLREVGKRSVERLLAPADIEITTERRSGFAGS